MLKKILYVLLILLLGGWVGFWATKTVKQIKPSITATPASNAASQQSNAASQIVRQESAIATQSAFLNAVQSVASLSASLSTLTITDTILNPPAIELPLGFSDTR